MNICRKVPKILILLVSIVSVVLVNFFSIQDHQQQANAQLGDKSDITQLTTNDNASRTYNNETYGISVKYPTNYRDIDTGNSSLEFIAYFIPINNASTNNASTTFVGIAVQNNTEYLTLSEYASNFNEKLLNLTAQLESSNDTLLSGRPAKQFLYTTGISTGNLTKTMNIATLLPEENKIVLFVYSAREGEDFERNLPVAEYMKNSIKLPQQNNTGNTK